MNIEPLYVFLTLLLVILYMIHRCTLSKDKYLHNLLTKCNNCKNERLSFMLTLTSCLVALTYRTRSNLFGPNSNLFSEQNFSCLAVTNEQFLSSNSKEIFLKSRLKLMWLHSIFRPPPLIFMGQSGFEHFNRSSKNYIVPT